MKKIRRVAVFCGSSKGASRIFEQDVISLSEELVKRQIEVVYGGGKVGLMGVLADAVLQNEGSIIGVIPKFLRTKELAHEGISEMILTENMHERKRIMNELCDAVITLPGGFGTMEEFFEILTWSQLGLHKKPICILNSKGFYNGLEHLVENMITEKFISQTNKDLFFISEHIQEIFHYLENHSPLKVPRWIDPDLV